MKGDERTQPWKALWTPTAPAPSRPLVPKTRFEEGRVVVISDAGGFTPKPYDQLYRTETAPYNKVSDVEVTMKKTETGKFVFELK